MDSTPTTAHIQQFFVHPLNKFGDGGNWENYEVGNASSFVASNDAQAEEQMTSDSGSTDPLSLQLPEGQRGHAARKVLSPLLLTGLMYTLTTGGAYGIEESVMGGGALLTIVSILIMPVVMGVPTALIVTELTCAVPSDAGFLMWIHLSFHRAVYLTMVILSLLYTFVDNALYPVMFSDYCCTMMTCTRTTSSLLRLGMIVLTFVLNLVGIEAVGIVTVTLTILTVLPFLLLLICQQVKMGGYLNTQAIRYIPAHIDWPTFITTASWNLSGLEQAASVVEDIKNPQRTIMRALIPLLLLVFLTYIPPVLAGASASRGPINLSEWQTGFWTEVSFRVGGLALKIIMVIGSALSAFGLMLSTLCTTTRVIAGMAATGAFPGKLGVWLSTRNARFGSHHWTLLLNTTLTALFSTLLNFGPLVKIDQFFYGIRVIMVFLAFFEFRRRYPHLMRSFRVPLSGYKLYLVFAVPFLAFAALTVIALLQDKETIILCLSIVGGTAVLCVLFCLLVQKSEYRGRIITVLYESGAASPASATLVAETSEPTTTAKIAEEKRCATGVANEAQSQDVCDDDDNGTEIAHGKVR